MQWGLAVIKTFQRLIKNIFLKEGQWKVLAVIKRFQRLIVRKTKDDAKFWP